MLLLWRIRYLDTRDKQFKDRDLQLDTDTLDAVTKAAVETTHDLESQGHGRAMLRYRRLFTEQSFSELDSNMACTNHGAISGVVLPEYFEDENGNELTHKQMAVILSGNPNAVMFPSGFRQHDIEYAMAENRPVPIDEVSLSLESLNVLGYFARDVQEILKSSFYKDGPGKISGFAGGNLNLQTAVSDEEIRSFVTIFRRLYMENEPFNFSKAITVFTEAIAGYPLADWIRGIADNYRMDLDTPPDIVPFLSQPKCPFSRKRLIDVFLYTQYAHQPGEQRTRQFQECLVVVGNRQPVLTWLFLTAIWTCAMHFRNAGVIITDFYERYCERHKVRGAILDSVSKVNVGIGTLEKKEARQTRILREKAEELATAIWKHKGNPRGGPAQFLEQARCKLEEAMGEHGNHDGP